MSSGAPGSASALALPGLLGGGGADDKKVLNSKPSARSRAGVLFNLRGTEGHKVVCRTLADGHKVAKEMESVDTDSVATSEAPSVHPAYDLNLSLEDLEDDLDSEYLDKAQNNKDLTFINQGNECALSTALHLLLDQPKIKESILGKQHKTYLIIVSP